MRINNFDFSIRQPHLEQAAESLGPDGTGIALFRAVAYRDILSSAMKEINDPAKVQWRSQRHEFTNARGALIKENYDAFALRLHRGDREMADRLPTILALTRAVELLATRDMAQYFPALNDWRADEMTIHRYDAGKVGISSHRDPTRYNGIISSLTLAGEGLLSVGDEDTGIQEIPLGPGDLFLMRGPGLYEAPSGVDIRPMHRVDGARTSLMNRDNLLPDKRFEGVVYDNWPTKS